MPKEKEATKPEDLVESNELPEGFEPIPEVEDEPVEEKPEQKPEPEKAEEKAEEKPEPEKKEEPTDDLPKFEFAEPEKPKEEKPFMVIKHLGKEIPIHSEEEARNFIQKGFDYEFKVGKHGKLARILDEHPEFAKRMAKEWEGYVSDKAKPVEKTEKPQLKKLEEFENPNDWFWENHRALREYEESRKPVVEKPTQEPQWVQTMAIRDPEHFMKIAPVIPEYAERYLTKAQYDRVNSDLPTFVKFYEQVKQHVLKQTKPKTETPQQPKPAPSFRVKSGGGEAPTETEKAPWEKYNNEDFEKYMAQVKGIASY